MQSIKWGRIAVLGMALGFAPVLAHADDKPTPDEARKVINYYYHGKGLTPVLTDLKVCHDIQRDGDEKNECSGDVTGQAVKKGDSDYFWMAFMAPTNSDAQNIIVQLSMNGTVRWVKNVSIGGGIRNRTWLKHTFNKAGSWKLNISVDNGNTTEQLGTMDINVEE
jgi:hypothetical protein